MICGHTKYGVRLIGAPLHTVVSGSHFYNDSWILRIFFFFFLEDGPCVQFLLLVQFSTCFAKRTMCSHTTDLTTVKELKKNASFFQRYLPVAANETHLCIKELPSSRLTLMLGHGTLLQSNHTTGVQRRLHQRGWLFWRVEQGWGEQADGKAIQGMADVLSSSSRQS